MSPWIIQAALLALHVILATAVTAHVVLTKDDVRGAIGWSGLAWLTPVLGAALYAMFGINRIRRQAGRMRRGRLLSWTSSTGAIPVALKDTPIPAGVSPAMRPLATLVGSATGDTLLEGNTVDLLVDGDEAYPAMLSAIDGATQSIAMMTYIFDRGQVADRFVDALSGAVERGVAVRVLVDGVGARYSHPPILRTLRERGITTASFLPPFLPWVQPYLNLRNHRKLLVVDGEVGFCGGLNVRDGCLLALNAPGPTRDLHFRFRGPVVGQMMGAIAFDWAFATREQLTGSAWFPPIEPSGPVLARGISDGPDEDFETLLVTFLGALSHATRSIRIATPYFLPDGPLIDALRVAALKGVQVEIVLPAQGNLRLVQWAATAQLRQVLRWGCRVYLSPSPFDHSKLFLVDGEWSLVGSANWDPRSLRLNFEYGVECYSPELAATLGRLFEARIAAARPLTLADIDGRSLPVKLRDGLAWLAQPYL
jgi:cardiolipin synthase